MGALQAPEHPAPEGEPRCGLPALLHYAIAARLYEALNFEDLAAYASARRGSLFRALSPQVAVRIAYKNDGLEAETTALMRRVPQERRQMSQANGHAVASPNTSADWLAQVLRFEQEGELFRAYDLAKQGLAQFPDDLALKHRAVLCLASTGAAAKAAELLSELRIDEIRDFSTQLGLDVACLRPRLMKDAALAMAGKERAVALAAAADRYAEVYRDARLAGNLGAYYPALNVATLNLLAGNTAKASDLAREVLHQLSAFPADRKTYFETVSELEAQVVAGDLRSARDTASVVRSRLRTVAQADYRGLSSTVRQLRLVVDAMGLPAEWRDILSPPRVIHYLGHIIAPPGKPGRFPAEQEPDVKKAITEMLDAEDVGFGYGSLAAGADILFAEALLARGASLHVVLPFDGDEFIEISVRPSDEHWAERFETCLDHATTVRYATEDRYLGDDNLFGYCGQLSMGLALLRARHLSTSVEQIAVWDGNAPSGTAGTASDMARWRRTGMPQKIISVGNGHQPSESTSTRHRDMQRRTCAMLFSDIQGFSKLTDEQLRPFIKFVLSCSAEVIERNRAHISFANTWGDGLFVVFEDAGRAANCALELQEALSRIDMAANGLPSDMALRVGVHLGPVYNEVDPILKRDNFFGAHVSRTARVERVTPGGCVYATETMAAVLALHNADEFNCEYVGMTETAKHYGAMRMFLLSRVPDRRKSVGEPLQSAH